MPRTAPYALPDQAGRRWLITGATHGLGQATAEAAARAGATLVIAARNLERARELAAGWPGEHDVIHLDLGSLESVRRAAEALEGEVDVLVNNAGTLTRRREETTDGFERALGVNFLGPFAFTNLVADRVRERVVIVGSDAHKAGRMDREDPHFRIRRWSIPASYAQSKLADLQWGLALSSRLRDRGVGVQLVHPGWVMSNLYSAVGDPRVARALSVATRPLGMTPDVAAPAVLMAATADLPECSYVGPDGPGHLRGKPTLLGRSAEASDPRESELTWQLGVEETGTNL